MTPGTSAAPAQPAPEPVANRVPKNVPRVAINAKKLSGSISLLGARLDDVLLTEYHDTVDPTSPTSNCWNRAPTPSLITSNTAGPPPPEKPSPSPVTIRPGPRPAAR